MVEYRNFDKVLGTSVYTPHEERYEKIVNAIGFEDVKSCIPFTLEQLQKAYKKDANLNNLSMLKWDEAAGFRCKGPDCTMIGSKLIYLAKNKLGVNCFSCAGNVCVLKRCAVMWIEQNESAYKKE